MADDSVAAVYVGWTTFNNSIENLAHGIPNQIDRSTFPGLSGGVQSQLLSGFKFLGLMTADNKPTQALISLAVPDEKARKEALKTILQEKYAALFALDLGKTTPNQLNETMGASYGVTGDTKEKAVRFFLSAAQHVGIHLSRFLLKAQPGSPAVNGNRPARPRRTASKSKSGSANNDDATQNPLQPGTSRSVELRSGGVLTISATLDLFSLSAEDRKFVFELIDDLEKYAKEVGSPPAN